MEYKEINELESDAYSFYDVQKELNDGFVLIGIRTKRPKPERDGSFEEITTYILGKPILPES